MRDLSALPNLTVALIQTTLAWHDRQANLDHFEPLLEQARGADLIILPEMFTTGFPWSPKPSPKRKTALPANGCGLRLRSLMR
jgi:predicted amidohydrolase